MTKQGRATPGDFTTISWLTQTCIDNAIAQHNWHVNPCERTFQQGLRINNRVQFVLETLVDRAADPFPWHVIPADQKLALIREA